MRRAFRPSVDKLLTDISPQIFFIQESKMKRPGRIKNKMSKNYVIYELTRKNKAGGGLAIGVIKELPSVWIDEGSNEVEYLTVEVNIDEFRIRCVTAYGPQEGDKVERKQSFWEKLTSEVENSTFAEAGFILQMDGNLKAGPQIIPNDPHSMNNNGKLFKQFLDKNSHLTVVNSLDICSGLITRRRQTIHKLEESVLDFFVVCDRVLSYVKKLTIDEERKFVLTNYNKVDGKIVAIDSDHNTGILELDISYPTCKPKRVEMFNLKNSEDQERFRAVTPNSNKLSSCLKSDNIFEKQASN